MSKQIKEIICKGCGVQFKGKITQLYCSKKCSSNRSAKRGDFTGLATGTMGALSELLICADLMKRGWEVFRALSPHSNCDVLALKNGILLKLEIRTGWYYELSDGTLKLVYPTVKTTGKHVAVITHFDGKIHYIDFHP